MEEFKPKGQNGIKNTVTYIHIHLFASRVPGRGSGGPSVRPGRGRVLSLTCPMNGVCSPALILASYVV